MAGKVEGGAFYQTSLSAIRFEEYDKNDPDYGQPLLELGGGNMALDSTPNAHYAVFSLASGKGNLKTVVLPSHLKLLGIFVFDNLHLRNTSIQFNMDAHLLSVEGKAFHRCNGIYDLQLPAVDALGFGTFYGNENLMWIAFHENSKMQALPDCAFIGCISLTGFAVPATVPYLTRTTPSLAVRFTVITTDAAFSLAETAVLANLIAPTFANFPKSE